MTQGMKTLYVDGIAQGDARASPRWKRSIATPSGPSRTSSPEPAPRNLEASARSPRTRLEQIHCRQSRRNSSMRFDSASPATRIITAAVRKSTQATPGRRGSHLFFISSGSFSQAEQSTRAAAWHRNRVTAAQTQKLNLGSQPLVTTRPMICLWQAVACAVAWPPGQVDVHLTRNRA